MKACRTVSVVEDAHSARPRKHSSTVTTPSPASDRRCSLQEAASTPWSSRKDRTRATSHETTLETTGAERDARRTLRRAKRKAFFRKLFFLAPSPEEDELRIAQESVSTPTPTSKAMVKIPMMDDAPADDGATYKLNDGYFASMASILNQYKTDCASDYGDDDESETEKEDYDMSDLDSNTDMSEISVFDLEEEETDDENDVIDEMDEHDGDGGYSDYGLVPIPETELIEPISSCSSSRVVVQDVVREMPMYVVPPVRVPMEYTMQDRRGGTLIGGRHVLFTSAAFKRKQRQMLYHMRSIDEDAPFIVPQICDDDDDDSDGELNTSGVYALQCEWV